MRRGLPKQTETTQPWGGATADCCGPEWPPALRGPINQQPLKTQDSTQQQPQSERVQTPGTHPSWEKCVSIRKSRLGTPRCVAPGTGRRRRLPARPGPGTGEPGTLRSPGGALKGPLAAGCGITNRGERERQLDGGVRHRATHYGPKSRRHTPGKRNAWGEGRARERGRGQEREKGEGD